MSKVIENFRIRVGEYNCFVLNPDQFTIVMDEIIIDVLDKILLCMMVTNDIV